MPVGMAGSTSMYFSSMLVEVWTGYTSHDAGQEYVEGELKRHASRSEQLA